MGKTKLIEQKIMVASERERNYMKDLDKEEHHIISELPSLHNLIEQPLNLSSIENLVSETDIINPNEPVPLIPHEVHQKLLEHLHKYSHIIVYNL